MDRTIIHCDMNNFYASVELLEYPELSDKPVAVSGSQDNRHGIILAKNQPAKKLGIKTAETVFAAKLKCPDLILLKPHMEKYRDFSKKINRIYLDYTDLVEPFSIDESWLDVTASLHLFGSGTEIADTIRNRVFKELGLKLSAGVSFNKTFAKMGSEYKKPFATTLISRENFRSILWPMDVGEFFGVGKASAMKLREVGIHTIGDLALAKEELLQKLMGKIGSFYKAYALGKDETPVLNYYEREQIKSVGNGITFKRDLISDSDIKTGLVALADKVASRLRKYQLYGNTIKVDIKDRNFKTISRQKKIDYYTNLAEEIYKVSYSLVKENWTLNEPVRMLTVTVSNLNTQDSFFQDMIFDTNEMHKNQQKLEEAMDNIRKKYGIEAITYGSVINNDIGL